MDLQTVLAKLELMDKTMMLRLDHQDKSSADHRQFTRDKLGDIEKEVKEMTDRVGTLEDTKSERRGVLKTLSWQLGVTIAIVSVAATYWAVGPKEHPQVINTQNFIENDTLRSIKNHPPRGRD